MEGGVMPDKKKEGLLYSEPDTGKVNFVVNTSILCIHITLMVLYILACSKVMFLVNIGSIVFYLLGYYFIKKGKSIVFFTLMFFEIAVHLCLASYFIGYLAGFSAWCFALSALFVYPQFSDPSRRPKKLTVAFPILSVIIFFAEYAAHINGYIPDSAVSRPMRYVFYGVNTVSVFFAIIFFTYFFATSIIRSRNRMDYQMNHDMLTGLKNRYSLHKITDEASARTNHTGEPFSIAMADIDNFKNINDNYGYACGDLVIYKVASIIKEMTDDEEFFAGRYGGEKFLFIYTKEPSSDAMRYKMEKFRDGVEKAVITSAGRQVRFTVSVGVAKFHKGDDYDLVLKQAHDNLYKAKREGKNRII